MTYGLCRLSCSSNQDMWYCVMIDCTISRFEIRPEIRLIQLLMHWLLIVLCTDCIQRRSIWLYNIDHIKYGSQIKPFVVAFFCIIPQLYCQNCKTSFNPTSSQNSDPPVCMLRTPLISADGVLKQVRNFLFNGTISCSPPPECYKYTQVIPLTIGQRNTNLLCRQWPFLVKSYKYNTFLFYLPLFPGW